MQDDHFFSDYGDKILVVRGAVENVQSTGSRGDLAAALVGKGAFRRFQGALDRHGTCRVHWRVFSTERLAGRARAWLADQGYDALP